MQDNISSIISAIKVLKEENPDSKALGLLQDALKKVMKFYIVDMALMGSVISMEEVEEEFKTA